MVTITLNNVPWRSGKTLALRVSTSTNTAAATARMTETGSGSGEYAFPTSLTLADSVTPYYAEIRDITAASGMDDAAKFDAATNSLLVVVDRDVLGAVVNQELVSAGSVTPSPIGLLPTYVSLTDYAAIAAELPPLPALAAATNLQRVAAFAQATRHIDSAMVYQGRRFNPDQVLEFPRSKGERSIAYPYNFGPPVNPLAFRDTWDWDYGFELRGGPGERPGGHGLSGERHPVGGDCRNTRASPKAADGKSNRFEQRVIRRIVFELL